MTRTKLPGAVIDFLKLGGIRQAQIEGCDLNTRLFHDLAIYGEAAEDCMKILEDVYHVDMTNFDFDTFFPSEFPGRTRLTQALLWHIPFARYFLERKVMYEPLTLAMIETVIRSRQWPILERRASNN
jgi:hypothetical protein